MVNSCGFAGASKGSTARVRTSAFPQRACLCIGSHLVDMTPKTRPWGYLAREVDILRVHSSFLQVRTISCAAWASWGDEPWAACSQDPRGRQPRRSSALDLWAMSAFTDSLFAKYRPWANSGSGSRLTVVHAPRRLGRRGDGNAFLGGVSEELQTRMLILLNSACPRVIESDRGPTG